MDLAKLPEAEVDLAQLPEAEVDLARLPEAEVDLARLLEAEADLARLPEAEVNLARLPEEVVTDLARLPEATKSPTLQQSRVEGQALTIDDLTRRLAELQMELNLTKATLVERDKELVSAQKLIADLRAACDAVRLVLLSGLKCLPLHRHHCGNSNR